MNLLNWILRRISKRNLVLLIGFFYLNISAGLAGKLVTISGKVTGLSSEGKHVFKVKLYKDLFTKQNSDLAGVYESVLDAEGNFKIEMPIEGSVGFVDFLLESDKKNEIRLKQKLFQRLFLIEQDDAVFLTINLKRSQVTFSGKGSEKYLCSYLSNCIDFPEAIVVNSIRMNQSGRYAASLKYEHDQKALFKRMKIELLDSFREILNIEVYEKLKILYTAEVDFVSLRSIYMSQTLSKVFFGIRNITKKFIDAQSINEFKMYASSEMPVEVPYVAANAYLLAKINAQIILTDSVRNRSIKFETLYNTIKNGYVGKTRDALLLTGFLDDTDGNNRGDLSLLAETIKIISDKTYKLKLQELMTVRMVGLPAFNFSFEDINGKVYSLKDFANKTLVLDFWFTGCRPCSDLHPILEKVSKEFPKKDFAFVTVNVDKSKDRWILGLNEGIYTSAEDLNLYTSGLGWLHPLLKHYNYSSYPQLLVIDKNGKLISSRPVDPRHDQGVGLLTLLKKQQ